MNIHEYQAKGILRSFGVPMPRGILITSPESAVATADELGGSIWVVKAQIHAGGRGKAGGVRVCKSVDEVKQAATNLLGSVLVTKQTGVTGKKVRKIYVEEGVKIAGEYYLALLVDRESETVSFVVSPAGGMEIEDVAAKSPERILTRPIATGQGITDADCVAMTEMLGLSGKTSTEFRGLAEDLYRTFIERDCSLLELNPLVRTVSGNLVALDAKMAFDDNALYRQQEVLAMRDADEEDPRETEAAQFGLNYIVLDGAIGCMVNGAGLAMATMDMIQIKGAKPANFLDVGGSVTVEAVTEAFKLLFADAHVKVVLVNIFGGIVRCDIIANGLVEAIKTRPVNVPVVMRLVGTNEQAGRGIVTDAGLDVRWAADPDEAARMAAGLLQ